MKTLFATAFAAMIAATAYADDEVCMPSAEMEASLIDWYGETPVDPAARGPNLMWASADTGTWTLVQYDPAGVACVLSSGSDWRGGDAALFLSENHD